MFVTYMRVSALFFQDEKLKYASFEIPHHHTKLINICISIISSHFQSIEQDNLSIFSKRKKKQKRKNWKLQTFKKNFLSKSLLWSTLRSQQQLYNISFDYFYKFAYWSTLMIFEKIQIFFFHNLFPPELCFDLIPGLTRYVGSWRKVVQPLHMSNLVSYYNIFISTLFAPYLTIPWHYYDFKSPLQDNCTFSYTETLSKGLLVVVFIFQRCI